MIYRLIKTAILFSVLLLNSPLIFPDTGVRVRAQTHAIWNLEYSMTLSHDEQVISLLSKIHSMPEYLWIKTLNRSLDSSHLNLRKYILTRFLQDFPYYEQNHQIYEDFIAVCDAEYRDFIKKELVMRSDIERILLVLENIKKWKLRELFYQTSTLIAYSLFDVRKSANEALFVIADDRIYPIVLNLAKSENPVERIYAIDSLYYIRDERMVMFLLQLLNDKNKSVRYYALRSLEVLNSQDVITFYIRVLRSDVNDEVRILSADILARIKHPYAFNALLESLPDPNPDLRRAVLNALNEYRYVAAAQAISKQLSVETVNDLKIMEIKSLLLLNNSGFMVGLNHILKYENEPTVKLWAVYATGKLQDYSGYDALLENLNNKNVEIREETALALGGFKIHKSVNYLIDLLKNDSQPYNVQAAALYALKNIDDNSAFPDLFQLSITHSNIKIKAEVKDILKDMIDKRFK